MTWRAVRRVAQVWIALHQLEVDMALHAHEPGRRLRDLDEAVRISIVAHTLLAVTDRVEGKSV